ncbi:MAG: hypothetical protein NVS3B16_05070 [Vulcanimicrobiaceae bacterium]
MLSNYDCRHSNFAEPYLEIEMVWGAPSDAERFRQSQSRSAHNADQGLAMSPSPQETLLATRRIERKHRRDIKRTLGNRCDVHLDALDGLIYLNAILDCAGRQCIGFNVSQRADAIEAGWALEDALSNRVCALPTAETGVMLRPKTRSCMHRSPTAKRRRRIVHGNVRTRVRLETPIRVYAEAKIVITEWIRRYNETRPHSRLCYLTPTVWREQYSLEINAKPVQKTRRHFKSS